MVEEGLFYTKEHEWVRIEGDEAVIGISDHAQAELGDITFVELPQKGARLAQAETFSTVESVKAASDIYAPLSGEVIEVNGGLETAPEQINRAPYAEGWICRIKIADESEKEKLMDAGAYRTYLGEENK
jgi:glycine cleavage system H protein